MCQIKKIAICQLNQVLFETRHKNYTNEYADFSQRTYDYDALEKELLYHQTSKERESDHDAERLDKELQEQLKNIGKVKNNH